MYCTYVRRYRHNLELEQRKTSSCTPQAAVSLPFDRVGFRDLTHATLVHAKIYTDHSGAHGEHISNAAMLF